MIYGWNIYSLYDGQPLPGLAEAIRLKDPARVAKETARIENALRRMLAELRQAEVELDKQSAVDHSLAKIPGAAHYRDSFTSGHRASCPAATRGTPSRWRPIRFMPRSGSGCRITDVEGEERVDFLNNYTSLILGHAHPQVTRSRSAPSRARDRVHHADSRRSGTGRVARRARRLRGADPLLQFRHARP